MNYYCEKDILPKYQNGIHKGKIDWCKCVGINICVKVDNKKKFLFINNYNKKNHVLEILFNGINFEIRTDDVLYNRFDKIFNSVPLLYPHLVKYFKNGINDAKKYAGKSEKKEIMVCPFCKKEKLYRVNLLTRFGYLPCECSNKSISYPERIMMNILKQLKVDFNFHVRFKWMIFQDKNGKETFGESDFVIEDRKIIIEMDGGFHFKDVPSLGQFADDVKYRDVKKDMLAKENGYKTIRIVSDLSDFEYIKQNVLQSELSKVFDINLLNWKKIKEDSLDNITKIICDFKYMNPDMSVPIISKHLGYSEDLIRKSLKEGTKLGWCNYDISIEKSNAAKKCDRSYLLEIPSKRRKQICKYSLEGYYIQTYESIIDAIREYGKGVSDCLRGKNKSAYGFLWKYKTNNYKERIEPYKILKPNREKTERAIFCIDKNGNIFYFKSIRIASKILNIPETNISNCLRRNNQITCGGYVWKYADKEGECMTEKEIKAFDELRKIANEKYDGTFTITGCNAERNGYGCCFGICPLPTWDANALARGNTLEEAIMNCIENDFVNKLGIKSLEVEDRR